MRRQKKFCLLKFMLFDSIIVQIITLSTIIVPKLYLYNKWKNNQRKYQESPQQTWLNTRRFSKEGGY
jgi:hypothetical protein